MDAAKNAVKEFMHKSGHHDTTVHEKVAPAVTHETQHSHHHDKVQTAIDKEVHQDHYHTSVQPVKDREVLPEQHHHNLAAVEHRKFEHGNDREVADRLKMESAQFANTTADGEHRHTTSNEGTIAGEHIHHHVHETIQPVVQRDVIQPHVTHTTVPIHEVHHNAAQHHTASALPAVSMNEFKKQGGVLGGREERYDGFEGEPRSVGGSHHGHAHGHHHDSTGLTGTGATGTGLSGSSTSGTGLTGSRDTTTGTGLTGSRDTTTGTGLTGSRDTTTGTGLTGSRDTTTGTTGTTGDHAVDSKTGKPSLLDRLNPMKDTDHDGKKGFMD